MKALTICQPYAHLIAIGHKPVENRTWPTSYRGPLAIHAGKSRAWIEDDAYSSDYADYPDMVFGAVVAIAQLVDCRRVEDLSDWLKNHPDLTNGPWCFVLEDIERLAVPVPARGAQGLWEWNR